MPPIDGGKGLSVAFDAFDATIDHFVCLLAIVSRTSQLACSAATDSRKPALIGC